MKEKQMNIQDRLQDTKQIALYLEAVIRENDDDMLLLAIVDVVKALKRIRDTPVVDLKEARKWLGRVCVFWDDTKAQRVVGILSVTYPESCYPFGCRGTDDIQCVTYYQHCTPITADDERIYKGE